MQQAAVPPVFVGYMNSLIFFTNVFARFNALQRATTRFNALQRALKRFKRVQTQHNATRNRGGNRPLHCVS